MTDATPILAAIRDGAGTAKEIGVPAHHIKALADDGLVVPTGVRTTGSRGRPATTYGLTTAGKKQLAKQR